MIQQAVTVGVPDSPCITRSQIIEMIEKGCLIVLGGICVNS